VGRGRRRFAWLPSRRRRGGGQCCYEPERGHGESREELGWRPRNSRVHWCGFCVYLCPYVSNRSFSGRTQLQWLTVIKSHCDLSLLNALGLRSNGYGWSKSRSQNSNCSKKIEKILVRFTWLTMDSVKVMFHFDERNYD
jgi:hypothetical protein